jgi:hypothetical protein
MPQCNFNYANYFDKYETTAPRAHAWQSEANNYSGLKTEGIFPLQGEVEMLL